MLSCDTFAICKEDSVSGQNILAKNSDRPLGEAQPLLFIRGRVHNSGEPLRCTHLTIPQAEKTYSVIGSKPYWMWGFEMGINEKGVVIGNEAQGSKNAAEAQEGLLGMDLLRLGLERGGTAYEAMHVIIRLLEEYGQNANANALFDRRYENSFMLMDPSEIWLLETAGRQWAAKKVTETFGISNCYAIGEQYDECSGQLVGLAREKRWIRADEPFHFAKAYTVPALRQTQSVPRFRRLNRLLAEPALEKKGFERSKEICRDHFEGELIEPRFGAAYGTFTTICMHALAWDSAQTAASLIASYHPVLGSIGRIAFSTPCCSVYMPVYWTEYLPAAMGRGGEFYEDDSMWWIMERLSVMVTTDYERFSGNVRAQFAKLEQELEQEAEKNERMAVTLAEQNDPDMYLVLNRQMDRQCKRIMDKARELTLEIADVLAAEGGLCGEQADFLRDYSERVRMPLV